jgi:hypothetical protein
MQKGLRNVPKLDITWQTGFKNENKFDFTWQSIIKPTILFKILKQTFSVAMLIKAKTAIPPMLINILFKKPRTCSKYFILPPTLK